MRIVDDDTKYESFENVLADAVERTRTRLLAYCVMPNDSHPAPTTTRGAAVDSFVACPNVRVVTIRRRNKLSQYHPVVRLLDVQPCGIAQAMASRTLPLSAVRV